MGGGARVVEGEHRSIEVIHTHVVLLGDKQGNLRDAWDRAGGQFTPTLAKVRLRRVGGRAMHLRSS